MPLWNEGAEPGRDPANGLVGATIRLSDHSGHGPFPVAPASDTGRDVTRQHSVVRLDGLDWN